MADKPVVFISHITEEAALAKIFQRRMQRDFLNMIELFVSTDGQSIKLGTQWLARIEKALDAAVVELVLCSHRSVRRPWINFEAGAGWSKGIVIPVCHTGMRQVDLPAPLSYIQAPIANNPDDLRGIYRILAGHLSSDIPQVDYAGMAAEIVEFERQYGVVMEARKQLEPVLAVVPQLGTAFFDAPVGDVTHALVTEHRFDQIEGNLVSLEDMGLIECSRESTIFKVPAYGPEGQVSEGGMLVPLAIRVLDAFREIAEEVTN